MGCDGFAAGVACMVGRLRDRRKEVALPGVVVAREPPLGRGRGLPATGVVHRSARGDLRFVPSDLRRIVRPITASAGSARPAQAGRARVDL